MSAVLVPAALSHIIVIVRVPAKRAQSRHRGRAKQCREALERWLDAVELSPGLVCDRSRVSTRPGLQDPYRRAGS
jgi:hypothetical protein